MSLYSPESNAAFDRAQEAYDYATPPDPAVTYCRCGHEKEDHEECPCVHGCDSMPCGVGGCTCTDLDPIREPDEFDRADAAYAEHKEGL